MKRAVLVLILLLLFLNTWLASALQDSLSYNTVVPPGNSKSGGQSKPVSLSSQFSAGGQTYTLSLSSSLEISWFVISPPLGSAWVRVSGVASGTYSVSASTVTLTATSSANVDGGIYWPDPSAPGDPSTAYFNLEAYAGPTTVSAGGTTATAENAHAFGYDSPIQGDPSDLKIATASFTLTNPQPQTYTLSIDSQILTGFNQSVYGAFILTGSPNRLTRELSFSGSSTSDAITVQLPAGTSFSLKVPNTINILVETAWKAINCSWNSSTSSMKSCLSDTYYTGKYNLSVSYGITSVFPKLSLTINVVDPKGSKRAIYTSSQIPPSGTILIKNVTLYNEKIEVIISATGGFGNNNYIKVTLNTRSPTSASFSHWLINGVKEVENPLTGTINSNLKIRAIYILQQGATTVYVLPGMDFLPSNGTHFMPLLPGVYSFSSNASVVVYDFLHMKLLTLRGVNTTLIVRTPYGESVTVGARCNKARSPSTSLPQLRLNDSTFYLLAIVAPEIPNITVYLKLNNTICDFRIISPDIRILQIQYFTDRARLFFDAFPKWENYNVTAVYRGKALASAPASQGFLDINYSLFENLTVESTLEILPTWGGSLRILSNKIEIPVLPVTVPLIFNYTGQTVELIGKDPIVLGENTLLSRKLQDLNEAWTPGSLYLRLSSRGTKTVIWEKALAYPYRTILPPFDSNTQLLEFTYIPTPTKNVVIVPWVERL